MNKKQLLIAAAVGLIFIVVLICLLAGTGMQEPQETTATTDATQSLPEAAQIYSQAVEAAQQMQTLTLAVSTQQQMLVGDESFTQETKRVQRCTGMGTDSMQIMVNESLCIGDYNIDYSEGYSKGTAYLTMGESNFRSDMSPDAFLSRHVPVILLDQANYSSIEAIQSGESIRLTFTQALAPEAWAVPEGAVFQTASGTATVSADHTLIESSYSISYMLGDVTINKTFRAGLSSDVLPFKLPATFLSTHIASIDAPLLLERSCGYLLQLSSVRSGIRETIVCEAYSDTREQTVALNMRTDAGQCTAGINVSTTLINTSRGNEVTVKHQSIRFADEVYTISIDGADPTVQEGVSSSQMRTYCQDYLVSTVLIPDYITGAGITDAGNTYLYEFSASEAFSQLLCQSACQILYQDPTLMDKAATSNITDSMTAHLQIDKRTGLPVSSGIRYCGTHFIEGYPYLLSYETEQTYDILEN